MPDSSMVLDTLNAILDAQSVGAPDTSRLFIASLIGNAILVVVGVILTLVTIRQRSSGGTLNAIQLLKEDNEALQTKVRKLESRWENSTEHTEAETYLERHVQRPELKADTLEDPSAGGSKDPKVTGPDKYLALLDLVRSGEKAAALDLGRAMAKAEPKESGIEGFVLRKFAQKGDRAALVELEALAKANPTHVENRFHWGAALLFTGEEEAADQAIQEGLEALQPRGRLELGLLFASALIGFGRSKDGLRRLVQAADHAHSAPDKAKLLRVFARLHEESKQTERRVVALEGVLRAEPGDTGTRFDLAHLYSEHGSPSMALFHYLWLLRDEPDDVAVLNNAGVDSRSLDLRSQSVRFYQRASDGGNTLASANLAQIMVEAGFSEHARALLSTARESEDVHPNVSSAETKLHQTLDAERDQLETLNQRAGLVSRVQQERAYAEVFSSGSIALGRFVGHDVVLTLNSVDGRVVKGALSLFGTAPIEMLGDRSGHSMSLRWHSSANLERPALALSGLSTGRADLVYKAGALHGIAYSSEVDPLGAEGPVHEWTLQLQE